MDISEVSDQVSPLSEQVMYIYLYMQLLCVDALLNITNKVKL